MSDIWIIDAVVKSVPELQWALKNGGHAVIPCYLPADDMVAALKQVRIEMRHWGFEIMDIERCLCYRDEDWSGPSREHGKVRELAAKARKSNRAVVGKARWLCDQAGQSGRKNHKSDAKHGVITLKPEALG